jgi:UDP-N-acetylglucosamine acyltransferase
MISNLAYVDPKAKLGANVTVEPFAYIQGDVEIGDGTWVGPNAAIFNGARIGKNCRIFNNATISAIPQDLKFSGEETTLEIGDNTTVREYASLHRGTRSTGKTVIGSNCLLMTYIHVAHDCVLGNNIIMGGYSGIAGEVKLNDWVILGGNTMVHQFVRIGAHVIIGGGSKVRIDVPPFIKADREPLAFMGINTIGLERRGFSKEQLHEIHEIYRAYYNMGMNTTQALQYIEQTFGTTAERDLILEFIKSSERGVIKGR